MKKEAVGLDDEKQLLLGIKTRFLRFWEKKGLVVHQRYHLHEVPPSLLVVNSSIAPYLSRMGSDKSERFNDCLIQPCIRLNSINNKGLLFDSVWSSSFYMAGVVTTDHSVSQVTNGVVEYLTQEEGVQKDELHTTVHPEDHEGRTALGDAGIDQSHVDFLADNSDVWVKWQFGKPGPFGRGTTFSHEGKGGAQKQFLNVILINRYTDSNGVQTDLPVPIVDMGFGIERFASVMKGVEVFDLYYYRVLIKAIENRISNPGVLDDTQRKRLITIADGIRTVNFMLSDGYAPGNKGAEYMIRKTLRNVFLQERLLGAFLGSSIGLFPTRYKNVLKAEFSSFTKIVSSAEAEMMKVLKKGKSKEEVIEYLHDSKGIPVEVGLAIYQQITG